jgi:acyl-CoA synthetase (AMP-forming)/AMP-acid ligase II
VSRPVASTVGAVLHAQARERGDADFVVTETERLTYAAAEHRSREFARALVGAGVARGERVGILLPTGIPFAVAWLAVVRIGAVAVPISTFSKAGELHDLLRRAAVRTLIGAGAYRGNDYVAAMRDGCGLDLSAPAPVCAAIVPNLRRVHLAGDAAGVHADHTLDALFALGAAIDDTLLDAIEADVSPADRMVIVHTSGSTSAPKGVIHHHGTLVAHLQHLNAIRGLVAGTRYFSMSPMFWIGGLAYNLLGVLVAGATLLAPDATAPTVALDFLERERPEMVNGYAQSIAHLIADPSFPTRDFSSVRAGNLYPMLPPSLRPRDPELRHNMLGITEGGSVVLADSDDAEQPESRRGSFGRPVPDLEAKIVDRTPGAGPGRECPVGTEGELWLRGPNLMEGYDGREWWDTFTPDGWYRTGDRFVRDADGYLYFRGRADDVIKTGGANVSPREVEAVLAQVSGCLPIVVGVPDEERGAVVGAVLVAGTDVALDLDDVREQSRAQLSAFKVPRVLVRMTPADVPTLSSGKTDLPRLIEKLAEPEVGGAG